MKRRVEPRSRRGFTLTELLVAMVIASMASAVVLRSLSFSLAVYQARSEDTAAYLLQETVCLLVQDDLTKKSYAEVTAAITNKDYASESADAQGYGMAPQIPKHPKSGETAVALPAACYGFGEGNAQSRKVKISVGSGDGESYVVVVSVRGIGGSAQTSASGGAIPIPDKTFTVTPLGSS